MPKVDVAAERELEVLVIAAGNVGPTGVPGVPGPVGPPGPQGEQGPSGGAVTTGWWDYDIRTTAPPGTGQVRTANPIPLGVGDAATIWLHATDDDGLYWVAASPPVPGDELELRGTAGAVQRYAITSFALTVPGAAGYATIQATLVAANKDIAKTARVQVALIREPAQGPPGPPGPPGEFVGNPLVVMTSAEYAALPVKDPATVYVLT